MNTLKFNTTESQELSFLENYNITSNSFNKIIEKINTTFELLGIDTEGLQLYYERHADTTSVLAIQVIKGDINDHSNYMLNGCKAWISDSRISCDVFMHADAKCAQTAMKLGNQISRNIVEFFEEIEKELVENNYIDKAFSLMTPLQITKEEDMDPIIKEESHVKRLIKKFFKKY